MKNILKILYVLPVMVISLIFVSKTQAVVYTFGGKTDCGTNVRAVPSYYSGPSDPCRSSLSGGTMSYVMDGFNSAGGASKKPADISIDFNSLKQSYDLSKCWLTIGWNSMNGEFQTGYKYTLDKVADKYPSGYLPAQNFGVFLSPSILAEGQQIVPAALKGKSAADVTGWEKSNCGTSITAEQYANMKGITGRSGSDCMMSDWQVKCIKPSNGYPVALVPIKPPTVSNVANQTHAQYGEQKINNDIMAQIQEILKNRPGYATEIWDSSNPGHTIAVYITKVEPNAIGEYTVHYTTEDKVSTYSSTYNGNIQIYNQGNADTILMHKPSCKGPKC